MCHSFSWSVKSICLIAILTTLLPKCLSLTFNEGLTDKQALDHLLHDRRYDKRTSPPGGTIHVNVSVVLLSLSSPDESSLNYEVEFLMHQTWTDSRLAFSVSDDRPYLSALAHHASIWKPDIFIIKHGTYKSINPTEVSLRIYENGTIFFTMRRHLVLNCEGDLHIFPFDSPMCTFSIESLSFSRNQMVFHWSPTHKLDEDSSDLGGLDISPLLKMHNAYLVYNETLMCDDEEWRGEFSCLKVNLHFTRDKWFYYTTVFVPGLILVTSSFVTFWIEWNAEPARVMLGVTTMLNFFTTSNKFRSKLPVVSNLTAMNMWDGVCMFFIYASFLEFIVVNYLARWVQDPETQRKKRENAILDSLRIVTTTLDLKHPDNAGTLGGQLHFLGGNLENKLREVKERMPPELAQKMAAANKDGARAGGGINPSKRLDDDYDDEDDCETGEELLGPPIHLPPPSPAHTAHSSPPRNGGENNSSPGGGYTLQSVKKIDTYSRRIFPCTYILFVLYFFIRYHAIEGELSIGT